MPYCNMPGMHLLLLLKLLRDFCIGESIAYAFNERQSCSLCAEHEQLGACAMAWWIVGSANDHWTVLVFSMILLEEGVYWLFSIYIFIFKVRETKIKEEDGLKKPEKKPKVLKKMKCPVIEVSSNRSNEQSEECKTQWFLVLPLWKSVCIVITTC